LLRTGLWCEHANAHPKRTSYQTAAQMLCDEKTRLLDAYLAAVDRHAVTVSMLAKTHGKGAPFKKALANAEVARRNAETSRLALRDHTETHGC
jgi:hypothetical protein